MGVKEVGKILRQEREGRKLTQTDVARRIGMSRESVSNYENGDIQVMSDTLLREFCAALDLDFEQMVALLHDVSLHESGRWGDRAVSRTLNLPPNLTEAEARYLHLALAAFRQWASEMGIGREMRESDERPA